MPLPDISVTIPARNEGGKVARTIQSIARARTTDARVEFVIVDDASSDETIANLVAAVPDLLKEPKIDIQVHRLDEHTGIYVARNHAAHFASGEIIFGTDAHVRFSDGWDEQVFHHIGANRILCGTTVQQGSPFRGYGCDLAIPFMGTAWNHGPVDTVAHVPIAPCHASVMTRELFHRLGGYDSGMIMYGAGEPELSIRAWLQGADVMVVGDLQVEHEFKPKTELADFLSEVRAFLDSQLHPFWLSVSQRTGMYADASLLLPAVSGAVSQRSLPGQRERCLATASIPRRTAAALLSMAYRLLRHERPGWRRASLIRGLHSAN